MTDGDDATNYDIFRECLSTTVIERLAPAAVKAPKNRASKGRKNSINTPATSNGDGSSLGDAAELTEFVEV